VSRASGPSRCDRKARNALIERHLPLARALALRYRRSPEEIEDLVQVASLGLVKAVDCWDRDRGVAFTRFAVPTILGELQHHRLGRSPAEVTEAVLASRGRTASSLDASGDEDGAGSDAAVDALSQLDPGYARADARATIERLVGVLDDRAREVLHLRFDHDLLQSQIAAAVGRSQMHLSRILAASLEALGTQAAATP
jgi:RNA polymerase sigma-B factor